MQSAVGRTVGARAGTGLPLCKRNGRLRFQLIADVVISKEEAEGEEEGVRKFHLVVKFLGWVMLMAYGLMTDDVTRSLRLMLCRMPFTARL